MRRPLAMLAAALLVAAFASPAMANKAQVRSAADRDPVSRFRCQESSPYCAEAAESVGYNGEYTGHDEPSTLFYSNSPGAGNDSSYRLVIPKEPPVLPNQAGTAGTFNFENHIAFWFGMALCDNQSGPEFTNAPCTPDTDSNIFDGSDPTKPDYIGRHPGTAFLEVQFYPPGWAPFQEAISCDATKWCAAMAIFSFNSNQNTGVANNSACVNSVGIEPANFAFITLNGRPHARPDPLGLTLASFTPNPATDLFMNPGDQVEVSVHDSPAGLVASLGDQTTHQSGSMTASAANGFAQINYQPTATTCTESPYTFRPMYASSSEHTRVPWAAHSYNVAFADETGHFELCSSVNSNGTCASGANDPGGADGDDVGCLPASQSLRVQIGGCTGTDNDFDGVPYQPNWPGTSTNPGTDARLHPSPVQFSSPTFSGGQNYSRVAFEADLPRIEAADFGGNCDRSTGTGCVNPPPGSNFYPFYTTRNSSLAGCFWQLGGAHIPGTKNTFGGNSASEFGPLLFIDYPGPGFTPIHRTNDFRRVLSANPCARQ
jgi:hypothetical protein